MTSKIPDEIRDELRARVLEWADRKGECLIPRKRSMRFHGNHQTLGAFWAMGVTGQVWGRVDPGICEHKGCIAHTVRSGLGAFELDPFRVLPSLPGDIEHHIRPHPFHPVAIMPTKPRLWWLRWHGTEPEGKVWLGACGVKGCVKHLRVVK